MTEKVEAVQRMQSYIEAHLTERMADLSNAAFFSRGIPPGYSKN